MGLAGRGITLVVAIAGVVAPAAAETGMPPGLPFAGAYAGPEGGAHEHHFYIERRDGTTGVTDGRYYRAWGIGGGAFTGYDLPLTTRIRIGVEASLSVGGEAPVARFADGTSYARHPQWGLRGTARAGYVLGDRLLAYGTFGYGGHHYRVDNKAGVTASHDWGSSFTIGAGLEYRVSPRMGVRLDFRHLDNAMSHILIGVPIRF